MAQIADVWTIWQMLSELYKFQLLCFALIALFCNESDQLENKSQKTIFCGYHLDFFFFILK